jgi:hypothetical protein
MVTLSIWQRLCSPSRQGAGSDWDHLVVTRDRAEVGRIEPRGLGGEEASGQ